MSDQPRKGDPQTDASITNERDIERLRQAFAQRTGGPRPQEAGDTAAVPAERLWRAVRGELPKAELEALLERTLEDPDLALEWRLARELEAERRAAEAAEEDRPEVPFRPRQAAPRWRASPLLAAALALAVVSAIFFLRPTEEVIYRDPGTVVVESALGADEPLPRRAATLRWIGPADARYDLSVLAADDLRELYRVEDLVTLEHTLPADLLLDLPAGTGLLWRVEAHLPDGSRVASPTYRQTLRGDP